MKIAITGVAGFLGSHLADAFLAEGHEVVGVDSMIGGDFSNIPVGIKFYMADCNELESMAVILEGVDVVYHCAATAYEGLSVFSPSLVTNNIVGATVATISAAIQNKVRRFVYCSSMARYGTNQVPFTEDMEPRPQDPYGIGKYACELYLRNLAEVHGMEYVIAVPHNIIGPRQKYDDPFRNVASIMINRMLRGQQPIIYGDGDQRRCFSFVADDIKVLKQLATADVSGEVINIGPDEQFVSIYELAMILACLLNFDLDPIFMPDRPQEVRDANCSADKARRLLGYKTEYSLVAGLSEMIEHIRATGPKEFQYHLPIEIKNERTPRTWTDRII
jgi:UDP-glucose 4-epimerase